MISYVIFLPVLASILIALTKSEKLAKFLSVLASFAAFVLCCILAYKFDYYDNLSVQFIENADCLSNFFSSLSFITNTHNKLHRSIGFEYSVGLDGISLSLLMLSNFLTPVVILSTVNSVKSRIREYILCILATSSISSLVFTAQNVLLFYVAFEAVLIPIYLIIGIFGGENKIYSSFKFFLYTFLGSLLMLVSIIFIAIQHQSNASTPLDFEAMKQVISTANEVKPYLFAAMFIAFAVKIPMIPFHTWLPDAHVQAPTGGSMLLAGILLKLGGYGLVRILVPMFPEISNQFSFYVYILSAIAVVYSSLIAFAQTDIKKIIAYSSIAHMGYVTAGIFSGNIYGISGAIFQMISHGVISAGLFLVVGILYNKTKTKDITAYGGFASKMPFLAIYFMILLLGSIGVPGTCGFVGEFLSIFGVFSKNTLFGVVIAFGVVLSAVYMLRLYRLTMLGKYKILDDDKNLQIEDIGIAEKICLFLLCSVVLILGIQPNLILSMFNNIKIF